MKKLAIILFSAVCALAVSSCAKAPEYDFLHDDCTIHSMYCTPLGVSGTQVSASIDNEQGLIEIAIPHDKYQKYYDLTQLKLKANIAYDAYITPSLSSQVWDLSEPLTITVTAKMTGSSKKYTIEAYKAK